MTTRATGPRSLRLFAFRAWMIALVLSSLIGVTFALVDRPSFVEIFPGAAAPSLYYAFLAAAGMALVAIAGMMLWRGWAVVLYVVFLVIAFALDRMAGAPLAHEVALISGGTLLLVLAYLNRAGFSAGNQVSSKE